MESATRCGRRIAAERPDSGGTRSTRMVHPHRPAARSCCLRVAVAQRLRGRATPTATESAAPATATPSAAHTAIATVTASPTAPQTAGATPTVTPAVTDTASVTPTVTETPTDTPTATATSTLDLASFYVPPDPLPGDSAGDLIRVQSIEPLAPGSRAWRVLYRSESVGGEPIELGLAAPSLLGAYFWQMTVGFEAAYGDLALDRIYSPEALTALRGAVDAGVCVREFQALVDDFPNAGVVSSPLDIEPWRMLARANSPGNVRSEMPVLVLQGDADTTVFKPISDLLAGELCALGTEVEYRVFAGQGHNESTARHMPEILAWTAARFSGEPAATTCP